MLAVTQCALLFLTVLGSLSVPAEQSEIKRAHFDKENADCDYPIRVNEGKVIHLQLENTNKDEIIHLFKGQSRFNEKILELKVTEERIDIITQTNEVCVWMGDGYTRQNPPRVRVQYTDRDPVMTEFGESFFRDECGSVIAEYTARLSQPKFDVMRPTIVLCDLILKIRDKRYAEIKTINDMKNSKVYADVYYENNGYQTYSLMNKGVITLPSNHVRIRQEIFLAPNHNEPMFDAVHVFAKPPATSNHMYCGSTYRSNSGFLLSPHYPLNYDGLFICDYIFPQPRPAMLKISFNNLQVPSTGEAFISVLQIKTNIKYLRIPIQNQNTKTIYLKSPSILRLQTPVKTGHGVSFNATYSIEQLPNSGSLSA